MLTEFWNGKGWIALIPLAMAALAFYAWVAIGADARAMERVGVEATATIVDTRRVVAPTSSVSATRTSINYFATVMFPVSSATDGTLQIHQTEHFVTASYYDDVSNGDQVWVRYLPNDPDRIELMHGGTQSNGNAAGWVALGMAGLSALIGGMMWKQLAKVHRFKTVGTPVLATITDITQQNSWTILSLTLPNGRNVQTIPVRSDPGYTVGEAITVLTEPQTPGQVLIQPGA